MSHISATQAAGSSNRRITSVQQLELLVEFMERHKDLALGRVHSKEARALASRLWNECAVACNAEGTYRSAKEWSRYWNDLKGRVKTKLRAINQSMGGTGGGPSTDVCLSPIEDRVANIIGRDVATPLPGVQQNPFLYQNATAGTASHSQQSQELLRSNVIEIEYEPDMTEQVPLFTEQRQAPQDSAPHPSQDSAPQPPQDLAAQPPIQTASQAEHRSQRSERRPRVHARRSSLLSQQVGESLDESRAVFVRLEESRIAAQNRRSDIECRKVEALQQIAQAIKQVADAVTSGLSTLQNEHNIRKRRRRIVDSSSDESDSE